VVVEHCLHHSGEDLLGDTGTLVDVVVAVGEDLGLDDGHKTVILADGSVAGEGVGGLANGELRGASISNLEDGSPLGKAAALGVEGGSAGSQAVETLSGALVPGATKDDEALVELDTGMNATGAEELNEVLSASGSLVDGLLVHDDAGDIFLDGGCGEEEFSVCASVVDVVLDGDRVESLSDSASGLVSSEDTLTRGSDLTSHLDELVLEVKLSFDHCIFLLGVR